MRWQNLFDDLETQLLLEREAEADDRRIEAERLRAARLTLADRLRSSTVRAGVRIRLVDGTSVALRRLHSGADWLAGEELLASGAVVGCVIPLLAVAALELAPADSSRPRCEDRDRADFADDRAPVLSPTAERLTLAIVLGDLARRRLPVTAMTSIGRSHGTIDRVGADHFDLAMHDAGTPRREDAVRVIAVTPFAQLRLVRF